MRTLIFAAAVLVLAAVAWMAAGRLSGGLPVEAARVGRGDIREFVDEHGKTWLPASEREMITMPYTGRIEAIALQEGDPVEAGQIVARLVPEDTQLALDAAQAAFDRAVAAVDESQDVSVENTALQQTQSFVLSMDHTVEAAAARVASGQAKRDYAERSLGRVQELFDRGDVTDDRLELAQVLHVESNVDYQQDVLVHSALLAMKAATDLMPTTVEQYIERKQLTTAVKELERVQAEIKLREAERDAARGAMRSPVAGVVISREISDERYLTAGTELLEIGRLEQLEVEADVLSQDVVDVQVGAAVDIYGPAIGPSPARGTVRRIYPAGFTKVSSLGVEEQRVKVVVGFDPDELERLRTERGLGVGFRVNVKIYTAEKTAALVVPRSALFRGAAGDWQVFVVRDEAAELQAVRVGLLNDEFFEVIEGLAEDDVVVLAPETDLLPGTRVSPILRAESAK